MEGLVIILTVGSASFILNLIEGFPLKLNQSLTGNLMNQISILSYLLHLPADKLQIPIVILIGYYSQVLKTLKNKLGYNLYGKYHILLTDIHICDSLNTVCNLRMYI